jgi:magnesium and cobalt exporter, CNNM family
LESLLSEWHSLLMMGALLFGSAFFSGAETAFFSLRRSEIRKLREDGAILSALVVRLLAKPRRLLVSILIGNLAINVAYFAIAVKLSDHASRRGATGVAVSIAAVSLLLLIFLGEFLPKGVALARSRWFARLVAAPMLVVEVLAFPVRLLLDGVVVAMSRLVAGREGADRTTTPEELKTYVRLTGSAGRLEREEREMLEDVIEFGELKVKEVMVPRVDMVAADLSGGREAFLETAREKRVSKVVALEGSPDEVRGFVAVKDLLYHPEVRVEHLLKSVPVVPETKTVVSLLKEFRNSDAPLALVVDEYGGTAGIVTPEDLIEEIVGEIDDEYDTVGGPVREITPGVLIVSGDLGVREWEEFLGSPVPETKVDTVGGFVTARLGRIPESGDSIEEGGYRLSVLRVLGGRVISLVARRIGETP